MSTLIECRRLSDFERRSPWEQFSEWVTSTRHDGLAKSRFATHRDRLKE